ncbi:30S ribosome-binding factor RbfA [Thiofilum flexile]|uniref:30S ribosome-binding factor RbfA n=1 Tax=Thiofilum flexile TaxID=125627 RepID=UPI00037D7EE9|nr:30S ribosome-binding factor RbfA [Thiofilum flexile]
MQTSFSRSERVAAQLKRELALLIRNEVKDPRVSMGMVSILDVSLSKDLEHAKVWFDVLEAEQGKGIEEALNHAAGFLRREVGRAMQLRAVPTLRFFYDDTQAKGNELSRLIEQAVASDRHADEGSPDKDNSGTDSK